MRNHIQKIAVRDLEPGDQVINKGRDVYRIVEVVRDEPGERILRVQWADGGYDVRVWNDEDGLSHTVEILREEGGA